MNILIIHQGFPGQFIHLIEKLRLRGDQLTAILPSKNVQQQSQFPFINFHFYELSRGNGQDIHPLALETESKILRGEAVARICSTLKLQGYKPDLVLCHPGWGESLFIKDIWSEVPQIHYVEFGYGVPGTDIDFDDQYSEALKSENSRYKLRMKNANVFLNLDSMTVGITPTRFQLSTLPQWCRHKVFTIHDGIDTCLLSPKPEATFRVGNKLLTYSDKVLTFVNRTFEPYRGIHSFMLSLERIQSACPDIEIVLIGKDTPNVSYGTKRSDNIGWFTYFRNKLGSKINWSRIHPVGKLPHKDLISLYQISSAHVYLTYPFVLSWSLLEAMSCGCIVIGSDTSPVRELIQHNTNGLLVPFSDCVAIADQVIDVVDHQRKYAFLRDNARETIASKYDLVKCLNRQISIIDAVATGAIAA